MELPIINLSPGSLPKACDDAIKALQRSNTPLFTRDNTLVRIVNGFLVDVDYTFLSYTLASCCVFKKPQSLLSDCSDRFAKVLLSRNEWPFPEIKSISHVPVLRENGTFHTTSGYDPLSKVFYIVPKEFGSFNPKTHLNRKECKILINSVKDLFLEFPFLDGEGVSVVVSSLMTGLIRSRLNSAPLHAFTAPKMGTGKSLLCSCVSLIVKGENSAVISQAPNESEEEKRLLSLLMSGDSIVCIDNVERPFKSSALCSILTEKFYKGRILGKSQHSQKCPTNVLFLINGNNLSIEGDLSSRTIMCRLDAKVESPEKRSFKNDIRAIMLEKRKEIIESLLSVICSYQNCSSKVNIDPFGRFEVWSKMIREPIIWCGLEDPCESRKHVEKRDPIRSILRKILFSWHEMYGEEPKRLSDVITEIRENNHLCSLSLMESFQELCNSERISCRQIGRFFSKHCERPEMGLMLQRNGSYKNAECWSIEVV